jgi:hypothetical protein
MASFKNTAAAIVLVWPIIAAANAEITAESVVSPAALLQSGAESEDPASSGDRGAAFAPQAAAAVEQRLLEWLALAKPEESIARAVTAAWAESKTEDAVAGDELLERLIESLSQADPALKGMLSEARQGKIPEALVYEGVRSEPFFRDHVRLWHARWLTQHRLYDEAQQLLDQLTPEGLIDPATYFFCRATCQFQLLQAAEARDSLTLLLNNTLQVPPRYRAVAEMMQQELREFPEDGMPRVARVMNDVHRRLDLGRSGDSTQRQETRVIDLLDKLLEDMENQQDQQNGGGSGGQSQQNQSGQQGASQSQVKGAPADGVADRKELAEKGSWGMLDKQSEAKARELIRQQFPANYLDAISKYTQKIAEKKR